jgi:hypothetical protein
MTASDMQQEIDRSREGFGDTMEELAAKGDMKARAWDRAANVKDKATELSGLVKRSSVMQRRWPLAVAAGVLVVGSVALRRRRRK